MWATPCERCIFHRSGTTKCQVGQYCVAHGDKTEAAGTGAPGFCRLFRSDRWARKHVDQADDYEALARQEAEFRYAAVVLLDEQRHSAEHLERTITGLEREPEYDQVIVVDMTGLNGSNGVARVYQKGRAWHAPVHVERIVERVTDSHTAVQFAAKLIREPYFLVVEAGQTIEGLAEFATHVRDVDSRVVYWCFPILRGRTQVAEPFHGGGVYITQAFRQLGGNRKNPFFLKLRTIEEQLGILLTWTFDRCVVRHGL